MSLNGTESEASSSTPPDTLTYKAYISNLAKKSPLLTFNSLSENDFGINSSTILSEFALLLTSLGVPGPSDLFARGEFLGAGAHFTVFKRDIIAVANFQKQRPAIQNDWRTVAVKMPIFLLDPEKKLDLADSNNSRQVRSMVLEITALCHPRLREHPNLVTLLAWGSSSLDWHEVPFIALEIADTDLAGLLQDQRDVSTVEKYQLALDIACGLDAIHEIELVHGDLKPENVLIFWESGGYIAKLADFGGAANVGKGGLWEGGGTIGWRAPEVQDFYETGKALDLSVLDRVDSYSFGLLLWSIFLRERARAPHDETNVNVERIALANLDDNCKNIPASLAIILKDSFSSLLKLDPRLRTNKLASLLNRDSQEHNDQ
ncbi:MAG: hypothetical protein LQ351_000220 [Letrouitia transgressa]|nr:MAG: hypothetical protein LQ351_000220 [Letrouitia transgressa]